MLIWQVQTALRSESNAATSPCLFKSLWCLTLHSVHTFDSGRRGHSTHSGHSRSASYSRASESEKKHQMHLHCLQRFHFQRSWRQCSDFWILLSHWPSLPWCAFVLFGLLVFMLLFEFLPSFHAHSLTHLVNHFFHLGGHGMPWGKTLLPWWICSCYWMFSKNIWIYSVCFSIANGSWALGYLVVFRFTWCFQFHEVVQILASFRCEGLGLSLPVTTFRHIR